MVSKPRVPVLGFAAPSGAGKTTLLVKLIPVLRIRGMRLAVVKHAHHDFDIDKPGKDSHALRRAGAGQMLIVSSRRWALIGENEQEAEPALEASLARLDQDHLDLILVEGFKNSAIPKIELYRRGLRHAPFYPADQTIIAVAADGPLPVRTELPVLDINNPEAVARFIRQYVLPPHACACGVRHRCGQNGDD